MMDGAPAGAGLRRGGLDERVSMGSDRGWSRLRARVRATRVWCSRDEPIAAAVPARPLSLPARHCAGRHAPEWDGPRVFRDEFLDETRTPSELAPRAFICSPATSRAPRDQGRRLMHWPLANSGLFCSWNGIGKLTSEPYAVPRIVVPTGNTCACV